MKPAYAQLGADELRRRALLARRLLSPCELCPRHCGVDRLSGETGYCLTGAPARVYSYLSHHGEEPPISGRRGSGTVFFSGCSLRCVYCQNCEFSQNPVGDEFSGEDLAGVFLSLQEAGCHNVNLVTPTHVVPQILEALALACERGLNLPLVYNTSGYDLVETLRLLDGVVDVYMPDMRYSDPAAAAMYSDGADYVEVNRAAVVEMHRQVGDLMLDSDGVAVRGLLVRLLVLPNGTAGTEETVGFIASKISRNTSVSLMSQYQPLHKAPAHPELARRITPAEYDKVICVMEEEGIVNGFLQGYPHADGSPYAGTRIRPTTRRLKA